MPIKDTASFATLNGLNGPGRLSKCTKKIVSELIDAIGAGAPFGLACQAAGIHYDTFCDWRRRDPAFALQVDQAAARGAVKRLKKIEAQGEEGNWSALAWMIERRYPAEFSKPEIQIGIQTNLNAVASGANGHSLESIVVSDLEFLKLRELENYEHRPHERQAREVETEVVPVDLSGTLAVQGHPGTAVVSKTQAESIQGRVRRVDAKFDQLLAAKGKAPSLGHNGADTPSQPVPTVPEMRLASIVMPPGDEPGSGWWRQLTTGSSEREIERACPEKVCRLIMQDVLGPERAQRTPISFDASTPILLRDVHQAIDDLCGAEGWKALVRRGKR